MAAARKTTGETRRTSTAAARALAANARKGAHDKGAAPLINIALLRDTSEPLDESDILFAARVRAVCEAQGVRVVDEEVPPTERQRLEVDVERVARRESSPEAYWRARDDLEWRHDSLRWCAQHRSVAPRPRRGEDPFDLPLEAGRMPARLMVAQLSTPDDVEVVLRGRSPLHYRPTLEQLQMARAFCRVVDTVIVTGTPESWAYLKKVYKETFTQDLDRVQAIEAIEEGIRLFRRVRETDDWAEKHGVADHRDAENVRREHARRTRDALGEAFATASVQSVVAELRAAANVPETRRGGQGKRGALAIVTDLSLKCNAFGDRQRKGESYETAARRVKDCYRNARKRLALVTKQGLK